MSRSIEWPIRIQTEMRRSSGGSQVLVGNLDFAARRVPELLRSGLDGPGTPLIPRNLVTPRQLARGDFVYMPQNAWAWGGPAGGLHETAHRTSLWVLSELAMRRAAGVVRISEAIPDPQRTGLPVLHNVLDERFEEALEASRRVDFGARGAIVSVGSFVPYRNYPRLLEAHRRYRERGGRLRLILAGPAGFPRTLARVQRLAHGRGHVRLLPRRLERAEVLAMLRECELAILPSQVEASPVSLLEALVLSPRVAASDIPGHRGIAAGMLNGVELFDPMDVEAMRDALHRAESEPPANQSLAISTSEGRAERRREWAEGLAGLVESLRDRAPGRSSSPLRGAALRSAACRVDGERFPRVCVVSSNPMSNRTSNGIIMQSLLAGWPREQICQVYFPVVVPYWPEFDVCGDFRMVRPSGRVVRIRHDVAEGPDSEAVARGTEITRRHHLLHFLRRREGVHRWLKVGQEAWYSFSWIGRVLQRQLRDIRPDLVYAMLGNYCLTRVVCRACEALDLPVFIHVTDDFVTSLYEGKPFARALRAGSERWFRRIVERSGGRAGIGPTMAEEYADRYGGEWTWFAAALDPAAYDPAPRAGTGPLRFVFTGNLGLGRWESLGRLAEALRDLEARGVAQVRLAIHTFPEQLKAYGPDLDVPPVTELAGFVPFAELPRVYHEADVLVHVESFDPSETDYTALSLSSKVIQYLLAGRPILALSPAHLGSARVVADAGAGVILEQSEPADLAAAVGELVRDRDYREALGRNGRRWAIEHLAADRVRGRFRQSLRAAIEEHRRRASAAP